MHPRKAIRHHVLAMLTGAIPAIGPRWFKSRTYPLQSEDVPGGCVYTLRESNQYLSIDGNLDRDLDLAIDLYARSGESPDDELDDYCEAVEALMKADPTLGGLAESHMLAETVIGYDGEGERANGMARLRYRVRYITE